MNKLNNFENIMVSPGMFQILKANGFLTDNLLYPRPAETDIWEDLHRRNLTPDFNWKERWLLQMKPDDVAYLWLQTVKNSTVAQTVLAFEKVSAA